MALNLSPGAQRDPPAPPAFRRRQTAGARAHRGAASRAARSDAIKLSLYDALEQIGCRPTRALQRLRAVAARRGAGAAAGSACRQPGAGDRTARAFSTTAASSSSPRRCTAATPTTSSPNCTANKPTEPRRPLPSATRNSDTRDVSPKRTKPAARSVRAPARTPTTPRDRERLARRLRAAAAALHRHLRARQLRSRRDVRQVRVRDPARPRHRLRVAVGHLDLRAPAAARRARLFLAISQSGKSPTSSAHAQAAKQAGAHVVALVNCRGLAAGRRSPTRRSRCAPGPKSASRRRRVISARFPRSCTLPRAGRTMRQLLAALLAVARRVARDLGAGLDAAGRRPGRRAQPVRRRPRASASAPRRKRR